MRRSGWQPSLFNIFSCLSIVLDNWDLFREIVARNIRQRYRGAILGNAWGVIHPLMMTAIYTFIFGVVFRVTWEPGGHTFSFPVNILCGLLLFSVLTESVNSGSTLVSRHPNYVKKIIFPLEVLPVAHVVSAFYFALMWFPIVLAAALLVYGFHWTMFFFPLLLIPLFFLCLGCCFFVASLGVYFRDTSMVAAIVMQIMLYVSAVIFPLSRLSPRWRTLIRLNPMTTLIDEMRKVFLLGRLPDWKYLCVMLAISIVVFQLGFFWFYRTKKGFADVI